MPPESPYSVPDTDRLLSSFGVGEDAVVIEALAARMGLSAADEYLFHEALRLPIYQVGGITVQEVHDLTSTALSLLEDSQVQADLLEMSQISKDQIKAAHSRIDKKVILSSLAHLIDRHCIFPGNQLRFVITLLDTQSDDAQQGIITRRDLALISALLDEAENIPIEARAEITQTLIGERIGRSMKRSLPRMAASDQDQLTRSMLVDTLHLPSPAVQIRISQLLREGRFASRQERDLLIALLLDHSRDLGVHEIEALLEVAVRNPTALPCSDQDLVRSIIDSDHLKDSVGRHADTFPLEIGPRIDLFSLTQAGRYMRSLFGRLLTRISEEESSQGREERRGDLRLQETRVLDYLSSVQSATRSEIAEATRINGARLNSTLGRLVEQGKLSGQEGYGDVQFALAASQVNGQFGSQHDFSDAEQIALLFRSLGYEDASVIVSPDNSRGGVGVRWDLYLRRREIEKLI